MCHLILEMPIIGSGVVWFWPLPVALPVYRGIRIVSGGLRFVAIRAMKCGVQTGAGGMAQRIAQVIDSRDSHERIEVEGRSGRRSRQHLCATTRRSRSSESSTA